MNVEFNKYLHFLLYNDSEERDAVHSRTVEQIFERVKGNGFKIYEAKNIDEAYRSVNVDLSIGAFLLILDKQNHAPVVELVKFIRERGLETPIYIISMADSFADIDNNNFAKITGFICLEEESVDHIVKEITYSLNKYGKSIISPFFGALLEHNFQGSRAWTCPGHQGGVFFKRSPAGRIFFQHMGEAVFRDDLCNAQIDLGDLLIHEGPALDAQAEAAKIYGSDRTYFVMNGTSTSNKIVNCALLAEDDLILFDRNNHKSIHQGALFLAGATPIYLDTNRNQYGMIGPINWNSLDETVLRNRIKNNPLVKDKNAWTKERPFRLAVIEQCTYDGTLYNAKTIFDKIGHLCDFILFDEAWAGFGKFHPLFKNHFSMGIEDLDENSPGIIATQSTHKQLAGFSQASQIHIKDNHIKGTSRRVEHRRFNEMFMLHASTSPFYPLFASLDVCAQIHKGKSGEILWDDTIKLGIEVRKKIRELQKKYAADIDETKRWFFNPFVPEKVKITNSEYTPDLTDIPWEQIDTNILAMEPGCWEFNQDNDWHGYKNISDNYAMVDPNKLTLLTPGINRKTGEYEDFGIPATILTNYLRDNDIIPEKCDLNSILFLMTPGVETSKASSLISHLVKFKELVDANVPMHDVVPTIYDKYRKRYAGYKIRDLCQEMHDFYKAKNVKKLQEDSFSYEHFPEQAISGRAANNALAGNKVDYIPLKEAKDRIAATLALIYPPGIGIIVPGERYDKKAEPMIEYFMAFEEGWRLFPGFSNEIQGVYAEENEDGEPEFFTYVVQEDKLKK
jgi:arginine/lysine/ornithine decarboxylase